MPIQNASLQPARPLKGQDYKTLTLAAPGGALFFPADIDRIGTSKTFIIGSLFLAVCSWMFDHLTASHPEYLFPLYGLVGLSVGVVGAVPFVMVRAFPAEVRFTGISFSYNVSYAIFCGLTPIFVTILMGVSPIAPAWYVLALVGLALGIWLRKDLNHEDVVVERPRQHS